MHFVPKWIEQKFADVQTTPHHMPCDNGYVKKAREFVS